MGIDNLEKWQGKAEQGNGELTEGLLWELRLRQEIFPPRCNGKGRNNDERKWSVAEYVRRDLI